MAPFKDGPGIGMGTITIQNINSRTIFDNGVLSTTSAVLVSVRTYTNVQIYSGLPALSRKVRLNGIKTIGASIYFTATVSCSGGTGSIGIKLTGLLSSGTFTLPTTFVSSIDIAIWLRNIPADTYQIDIMASATGGGTTFVQNRLTSGTGSIVPQYVSVYDEWYFFSVQFQAETFDPGLSRVQRLSIQDYRPSSYPEGLVSARFPGFYTYWHVKSWSTGIDQVFSINSIVRAAIISEDIHSLEAAFLQYTGQSLNTNYPAVGSYWPKYPSEGDQMQAATGHTDLAINMNRGVLLRGSGQWPPSSSQCVELGITGVQLDVQESHDSIILLDQSQQPRKRR